MQAAFKVPRACHIDLDADDNTVSDFIMNKKPK